MKPSEPCSSADRADFEVALAAVEVCPRCAGCGWQMCDWFRLSREERDEIGMKSMFDCHDCRHELTGPLMPVRLHILGRRFRTFYVPSHECALCDGKGATDRATAVAEVIWKKTA